MSIPFRERLGMAWLALTARGEKQIATMVPTWKEGRPTYPESSFANNVKYGWRRNELIFSCISKTANTASQVELVVKSKTDGEQLDDHPLKQLIQRPNPYMSEFDFWAAVIIYQKLAGRAVFEKERSRGGQVVRLWPLRPDWLKPLPSSRSVVSGYEYSPPGIDPATLKTQDVLDFKLFDPVNMYHSWPPVSVAARVGDTDNAATDYVKLFFEKGGVPPGLLKTVQKLNDAAVADIRRRWKERYGGYEHWLEPAVLDSDAEYHKIGFNFSEMGFDVLDGRDEARICMVLDVPPIIVGAKVGLERATYSNYKEARQAWWEDSLIPLYASQNDVIANQLSPEFGDDITTVWDVSKVPALQEERNSRWTRAVEALRVGGVTVNEFREEIGLPDIGSRGEVFLRPMTILETSSGGKALPAGEMETKDAPRDQRVRIDLEKEIQGQLESYFIDQRKRVEKELVAEFGNNGSG